MSDQLVHISLRSPLRRAFTVLPLVLALAGAWFSVRWYLGDTIAEYLNPDDRGIENARLAAALAPSDPVTHWTLAELEQNKLPPDQINLAIAEYEQAARLAPNDYRFWLSLGRALEQADEHAKSEQAMRRAVVLAPAYAYPHWYLGNLLLRSGNEAEAFAEMRRAGDADPQLQMQLFNMAWQVYGKNAAQLNQAIGSSVETRAGFTRYLIDLRELDVAVQFWDGLSLAERHANQATGDELIKSMIAAKRFSQALGIWNELRPNESLRGQVGQLIDGGFEHAITDASSAGVFGWQIKSLAQAQAAIDSARAHSGTHSLRLLFKARAKTDVNVGQLVVVEPETQYELTCFVKTDNLESAGTPEVQIVDIDGNVLARSQPAPAGINDWQPIVIAFKTGAKLEAVGIRIARASCGENSDCPIFGTAWYDDFDLKRRG